MRKQVYIHSYAIHIRNTNTHGVKQVDTHTRALTQWQCVHSNKARARSDAILVGCRRATDHLQFFDTNLHIGCTPTRSSTMAFDRTELTIRFTDVEILFEKFSCSVPVDTLSTHATVQQFIHFFLPLIETNLLFSYINSIQIYLNFEIFYS